MFVFLTMLTLHPDGRLTGFSKATKTSGAAKLYWRRLNSKRSLPVLEWTSESEYFERFRIFFVDIAFIEAKTNHFTPHCACAARGKN